MAQSTNSPLELLLRPGMVLMLQLSLVLSDPAGSVTGGSSSSDVQPLMPGRSLARCGWLQHRDWWTNGVCSGETLGVQSSNGLEITCARYWFLPR
jgi:hypothetical protein